MSRIPDDIKQAVLDLKIEVVLGHELDLKRAGTVYKGRCPIHNEKTPSFVVSPAKGIFKCFGCGVGGDAIKFFMLRDAMSYPEAVKHICDTNGIPFHVEQSSPQAVERQDRKEKLFAINKAANEFFITRFKGSHANNKALERQINDIIAANWEIGFAPQYSDQDSLWNKLVTNVTGWTIDDLVAAGLYKQGDDKGYFPMFSQRMMFPIKNQAGKITGFSGRSLFDDQQPKYVNTPETDIFHKSKELFGIDRAKREIIRANEVFAVEGQTDVIAMHEAGFSNTVASLGTAFTKEHAKQLKKYTDTVTLLYDGDDAGLKAIFRACEELFAEGMFVYIVRLPEGEDPDSFIKKFGSAAMKEHIEQYRMEFLAFKMSLLKTASPDFVQQKAVLQREMVRIINLCPDSNVRQIMTKDYFTKFGFDATAPSSAPQSANSILDNHPTEFHVLRTMLLVMDEFDLRDYFGDDIKLYMEYGFTTPEYRLLFGAIIQGSLSRSDILNLSDPVIADAANEVLNTRFDKLEFSDDDLVLCFLQFQESCLLSMQAHYRSLRDPSLKSKMESVALAVEKVEAQIKDIIIKR